MNNEGIKENSNQLNITNQLNNSKNRNDSYDNNNEKMIDDLLKRDDQKEDKEQNQQTQFLKIIDLNEKLFNKLENVIDNKIEQNNKNLNVIKTKVNEIDSKDNMIMEKLNKLERNLETFLDISISNFKQSNTGETKNNNQDNVKCFNSPKNLSNLLQVDSLIKTTDKSEKYNNENESNINLLEIQSQNNLILEKIDKQSDRLDLFENNIKISQMQINEKNSCIQDSIRELSHFDKDIDNDFKSIYTEFNNQTGRINQIQKNTDQIVENIETIQKTNIELLNRLIKEDNSPKDELDVTFADDKHSLGTIINALDDIKTSCNGLQHRSDNYCGKVCAVVEQGQVDNKNFLIENIMLMKKGILEKIIDIEENINSVNKNKNETSNYNQLIDKVDLLTVNLSEFKSDITSQKSNNELQQQFNKNTNKIIKSVTEFKFESKDTAKEDKYDKICKKYDQMLAYLKRITLYDYNHSTNITNLIVNKIINNSVLKQNQINQHQRISCKFNYEKDQIPYYSEENSEFGTKLKLCLKQMKVLLQVTKDMKQKDNIEIIENLTTIQNKVDSMSSNSNTNIPLSNVEFNTQINPIKERMNETYIQVLKTQQQVQQVQMEVEHSNRNIPKSVVKSGRMGSEDGKSDKKPRSTSIESFSPFNKNWSPIDVEDLNYSRIDSDVKEIRSSLKRRF